MVEPIFTGLSTKKVVVAKGQKNRSQKPTKGEEVCAVDYLRQGREKKKVFIPSFVVKSYRPK